MTARPPPVRLRRAVTQSPCHAHQPTQIHIPVAREWQAEQTYLAILFAWWPNGCRGRGIRVDCGWTEVIVEILSAPIPSEFTCNKNKQCKNVCIDTSVHVPTKKYRLFGLIWHKIVFCPCQSQDSWFSSGCPDLVNQKSQSHIRKHSFRLTWQSQSMEDVCQKALLTPVSQSPLSLSLSFSLKTSLFRPKWEFSCFRESLGNGHVSSHCSQLPTLQVAQC